MARAVVGRVGPLSLGVVLPGIVACSFHVLASGPGPQAAPLDWGAGEAVCVIQPEDGGTQDAVYAGSGAAVASRVERVLRARQKVNVILANDLHACAASHGRYAIVSTIRQWQRHDGALFYSESAQLQMSLRRVGEREPLRTVSFETRSWRPNLLISPHDLLPKEFDDVVLRLLPSS